ncbi:hypothetical protein L3Q82_025267 [Scortum barcoo]|uniref:Uncharacterized protein n=1 Tax=Scortum barcoo TaxID=214431 RepID=A0ACB8WRV9_9TELE|nr:hypothetical protein L3Q82_025267 [Scortum barcoo]
MGFIVSSSHIKMDGEKVTFQWGPEAEGAFQRLQKLFTKAPVLTMPDPKLQFIVEVDASNEGLSSAERNYDVWNRELLAIKVALEEWRHWLKGAEQPFIVWTDHKNLKYLKPGSQNAKPDALSRLYESELATKEPEPILPSDRVVGAVSWQIENGVQWAWQGEPAPEGCPRNRLFVPEALPCSQVIHWVRTSLLTCHPGVKRTVFMVKQRFRWPSLAKDVAEYVAACSVCARSKASRQAWMELLQPLQVPHRPWSHISLDFVTGLPPSKGNTVVLTVVDRFSKMERIWVPASFIVDHNLIDDFYGRLLRHQDRQEPVLRRGRVSCSVQKKQQK